jgi:hypothetical protein
LARVSLVAITIAAVAPARVCAADNDLSSSTSPYFSTDGSLGVPVFGSFVSLDNWLRPVADYAIPFGPIVAQGLIDDSRKLELTNPTTFERVASTDVGVRVSAGGITRPGSKKEQYLVITCDAHPERADCLSRDPRLSLGDGASISLGGRVMLAPSHVVRGEAGEAIATFAHSPFLAYISVAGRRERMDGSFLAMSQETASSGASLRVFASPFAGSTYVDVGVVGRVAWLQTDSSDVHQTLTEAGLALQLRVSSFDVALRCMWERHDVVGSRVSFAYDVTWTAELQPTIFF